MLDSRIERNVFFGRYIVESKISSPCLAPQNYFAVGFFAITKYSYAHTQLQAPRLDKNASPQHLIWAATNLCKENYLNWQENANDPQIRLHQFHVNIFLGPVFAVSRSNNGSLSPADNIDFGLMMTINIDPEGKVNVDIESSIHSDRVGKKICHSFFFFLAT